MEIKRFKDKKEASKFISDIFAEQIKNKNDSVLGLATGSTPELVYEFLANEKLDFSNIKSFNLDEYVGLKKELEDQSYRYFMNFHLFDKVNINKENTFFPINFNEDCKECKKFKVYDKKIKKAGGIDLQILGIGNNGHIAFNEPGSSIKSITRCISLAEDTIKANSRFFKSINEVPTKAVSMGIKSILQSKKIVLAAFGENKKEALNKLINAKCFDPNWPCTALYDHPNVIVVTDIQE